MGWSESSNTSESFINSALKHSAKNRLTLATFHSLPSQLPDSSVSHRLLSFPSSSLINITNSYERSSAAWP